MAIETTEKFSYRTIFSVMTKKGAPIFHVKNTNVSFPTIIELYIMDSVQESV